MLLVTHLIDPGAGEAGVLACAAAIAASPVDIAHRVIAVGPSWVEARAGQLGLHVHARVAPGGCSALARARTLRSFLDHADGRANAVHAWSLSSGAAAHRAGVGPRLVVCGATPARHEPLEWLADPTVGIWPWQSRAAWAGAGAVDIRDLPAPTPSSFRPAWAGMGARVADYELVRAELGIEPEDEVVALIADAPESGDARRFVYLLGLLHVGGRRIVGLVPEGCSSLARAARYTRAHGRRWGLIPVRGPMCRALVGADVAALDEARPDSSVLLALVAHDAGVPVVRIGPGPAAPEVARRTAARAMEALDRRGERLRLSPGGPGASAFASTLAEVWRDAAAALHA